MKFSKKTSSIIFVCSLLLLNNCVQSTAALFGPALTIAKTGNIYQAGLSYGSNNILKKHIGKDPSIYVKDTLIKNFNQNKTVNTVQVKYVPRNPRYQLASNYNEDEYIKFITAVKKVLK